MTLLRRSRLQLDRFWGLGALVLMFVQAPASPAPGSAPPTAAAPARQAVIETSEGTVVIDLRPDLAPRHVNHFVKLAQAGAYDGTIFHRVVRLGIIQGGDPLSKDPAKAKQYGTGGLGVLAAEGSAEKHTRGAVSAVLQPGKPDSAGSQFFICVTDQPALDGKYTIFGRVAEGLDVVQKISEAAADERGVPASRMVMRRVTIRDKPPPEPEPFAEPSAALSQYRAVLDTSAGEITVEFVPDRAPEHVRNFLRLASLGVFDGTSFHRVVRGFVVQTGALNTRGPLTEKQQKTVRALQPEFNDIKHVKGILSMARGDDPASAATSFFIVTGDAPSLDGKYTVFGRVIAGMTVVEAIEQSAVDGESPVARVDLRTVRILKQQ
jgi:peptidyl-prolyl cis-trans isomerase B (cyclophilin B)